jgi:glycosyltransferase involved in cell wall biosynthesis
MKIKVAYDAITLANEYGQSEYGQKAHRSGVYTVTDEIAKQFNQMGGVELTLVCICSTTDHFYGSHNSLLIPKYIRSGAVNEGYKAISSTGSRLRLTSVYDRYCELELAAWRFYKLQTSKYSLSSIFNRARFKVIRETFKIFALFDHYLLLDCEKFDIFHSTFHRLPAKKVTGNLPRLLTIHDLIPVIKPEFVSPEFTQYFEKLLAGIDLNNDWVVCVSEYTRKQFCEYTGMAPERTFVTPLAAANHFYPVNEPEKITAVRERYCIPDGDYFLCLASGLAPHKNLDRLMRCFFKLISEHPELQINLVLAGSNRYKSGADKSHLDFPQFKSRPIYTGYVADEDLSALYSGATAFIFPSLFEGFGLPPLEAMQCGTPVIASNTTSLPEVVGDAGISIDPLDEDAICQAMLALATDRDLAQTLSQKGLERAKNFSWAKCANDTVEVYRKILSQHNSQSNVAHIY